MSELKYWEKYPQFWKTESAFMSFVRSGIRNGLWKKHRVKLKFLEDNVQLVVNTNPRSMKRFPMVKKYECAACTQLFSTNDIEVDHKTGQHSLKSMEDLNKFTSAMIMVTEEDLQLLCKECHGIKTLAEKQGISFEEASVEKKVIAICKAKKDKQFLEENGIVPESNAVKRRKQVKEILNGNIQT